MRTQLNQRFFLCLGSALALGSFTALGTPADGTVIGHTKITDHGPDASRYTLVIVSEGYQQSELGQFAQDAQNFVSLFLATRPFSTNCSAFNFYRIDVASTDSGADDPATCGDGSTGSGIMVSTYFDATFCTGSARCALGVNSASVINVANAQVPGWDALLVLVNTQKYGGLGGQVAVASLTSLDILIHELGHAGFGLGDEYEYYWGCGVDPAGTRDHHPAVEPVAENITVQTNPSLVKWRSLFFPGITIPTTVNPNCAQCDPQPDPFPGQQRVGLYEGADYYHCDAYRPVFSCEMRILGLDFCPVFIQRMMNVLRPYMPSNSPPVAHAGGPYVAECAGSTTRVTLDGRQSSDPDCNALTYALASDCPGATFDNVASATPVLTVNSSPGCAVNCHGILTLTDSAGATNVATANVTIRDTTTPTMVCPAPLVLEFTDANGAVAYFVVTASDLCSAVSLVVTPASGSVFPIGTTTVKAVAIDSCGNSNACSFTVEVLGAHGVKQNVLSELVALRAAVTEVPDANKLDVAITFLTASLAPALWVDQRHVVAVNGGMVFQREKQAVQKLEEVIKNLKSTIPKATLQNFIDRIVRSDRLLAVVALNEAIAGGGNPIRIGLTQKELARGDAHAAGGRLSDAIEGYRIAWMKALLSTQ